MNVAFAMSAAGPLIPQLPTFEQTSLFDVKCQVQTPMTGSRISSHCQLREVKLSAIAGPIPPVPVDAVGAATADVAGSSLAPRMQGSAHSEMRLHRCSVYQERSTGIGRAR